MLLLILHLIGDYILQSDKMATEKTSKTGMALLHAFVYSVPFWVFLDLSLTAYLVIFLSHAVIDRYRLARYVIFFKNKIHDRSLKWQDCSDTGFHKSRPNWLVVWLLIITDNTIHLTINYLAYNYL